MKIFLKHKSQEPSVFFQKTMNNFISKNHLINCFTTVPKYRIVYTYVQYPGNSDTVIPSKKYYVDLDDMTYEEALKDYAQLKEELQQSLKAGKEDCDVKDFDILRLDE